jgi:pilus assembly protein CpaC
MSTPRSFGRMALFAIAVLVSANAKAMTVGDALFVTVGKSLIIDSDADIVRVALSGSTLAEAVPINAREILLNGLMPGETSLVIWEAGGTRRVYNLTVVANSSRLDAVRRQLATELGGQDVTLTLDNESAFLRGTANDLVSAERAALIAGTLGKVVNLLRVSLPPADAQILLKVRFANVERTASLQLGINLITQGHVSTPGATTTGQITLGDALNILTFRPGFNLSATLTALESNNLVEILAEPNVLAVDGQPASFVAGGEFPYPTVQGGAAVGSVTIAFREFGVKIRFMPHITPRGTIRLHVAPEVSSLDFANGLVFQGITVPALVTRRVETEIELESGQSFVIAGLLDNRVTEILSKVPGLGNIPVLGKLFQSKTRNATNSELLVIITPELVSPIPAAMPTPDLALPKPFIKGAPQVLPRTPGMETTGPARPADVSHTLPVEQLIRARESQSVSPTPAVPTSTIGDRISK